MRSRYSLSAKVAFLFCAILIPLITTQFSMYKWGRQVVTDELSGAAKSNVVYLKDNFEKAIIRVYTQAEQLLTEEKINRFLVYDASIPKSEYYMTLLEIQKLLQLVKNSNDYIEEIRLYYKEKMLMVSSASTSSLEKIMPDEFEKHIRTVVQNGTMMTDLDGNYLVWSAKPTSFSRMKGGLPSVFVEVRISQEAIQNHLESFSEYSNKNALLYNHKTHNYVVCNSFNVDSKTLQELIELIEKKQVTDDTVENIRLVGDGFFYVSCDSKILDCSLIQLIPSETLMDIPNRFKAFILAIFLIGIVGIGVFSIFLRKHVKKPLAILTKGYLRTGEGDFYLQLNEKENYTYEFNLLIRGFNDMVAKVRNLIQNDYEKTIRLQSAEFKQLQAQINPHFLYNSLFCLRNMIHADDKEEAMKMLNHLGDYFRYIQKNAEDKQCLKAEFKHAMDYLGIQVMRFEGKVETDISTLPESLENVYVPRLILQPVFENIFEHSNIGSTDNVVKIAFGCFEEKDGYFTLRIEDSNARVTDETILYLHRLLTETEASDAATGLVNIHRRIVIAFGKSCGITVDRSTLGGLQVNISLHKGAYI